MEGEKIVGPCLTIVTECVEAESVMVLFVKVSVVAIHDVQE
jgi:hypothetical protein